MTRALLCGIARPYQDRTPELLYLIQAILSSQISRIVLCGKALIHPLIPCYLYSSLPRTKGWCLATIASTLTLIMSSGSYIMDQRFQVSTGQAHLSLNKVEKGWIVTWEAMLQLCDIHGLCERNSICEYSPDPGVPVFQVMRWLIKRIGAKVVNQCSQPTTVKSQNKSCLLKCTRSNFMDLIWDLIHLFRWKTEKLCSEKHSRVAYSYGIGVGSCYTKIQLFNGKEIPSRTTFDSTSTYVKLPKTANISDVKQYGLMCKPNSAYEMHQDDKRWFYYYISIAIFGGLELFFITTACLFLRSKQNIPKSVIDGYELMIEHFKKFSYRELTVATGNFREELGRGGSGVVYRGAEISIIGRINHVNLVRTWGFCSEGKDKLLVYDYVENESLDKHLFESIGEKRLLRWSQRFTIALGTARGLAYLHHECLEWVVHCDVKPENILLTQDFEVKIVDFGLAKLSKRDCSCLQLSYMRGTVGYMAPEWELNLPINTKVDVFSYGIVLLEIVMGARISSQTTAEGEKLDLTQIVEALKQVVACGDVTHIVDAKLHGQFNHLQAMEMIKISLSCKGERTKRPTMDEIIKALMACGDEDKYAGCTE
uniref:Protein kinase domain-containing protein n=1 Tax=Oryza punctata TaxID=4537 RepID=A0A0E0JM83_ORYPU